MQNRTHYEVLEVSKTATQEEIKKAYRKKALENHPDKKIDYRQGNVDLIAKAKYEEEFKQINTAGSILTDVTKRAEYDRSLEPQKKSAPKQQAPQYKPAPQAHPARTAYKPHTVHTGFFNKQTTNFNVSRRVYSLSQQELYMLKLLLRLERIRQQQLLALYIYAAYQQDNVVRRTVRMR